jgi:aspartyl-tRNA(Asn)/glutamyl-tRNA(Gln) amidotransferase subunit C
MAITTADVEKIAELARLELTREETESFTNQLSSIITHIDKLNELDTSNVAPMSHCSTATGLAESAWRDDIVGPSLGAGVATENAPDHEGGYFKVPRVIGG